MRRAMRCVLVVAALLVAGRIAAAQEVASIAVARANVRATPAIDASIVLTLSEGATVRVLERTETWVKIASGPVVGWVRANMLSVARSQGDPTAQTPSTQATARPPLPPAPRTRGKPPGSEHASAGPSAAAGSFQKGAAFLGAHVAMSGVGSTAAFGASGEVAYSERVGIGAMVDTWSFGDSYRLYGYSWNVRYIAIAGTGAYHFAVPSTPRLDPFIGASVGYYMVRVTERGTFDYEYSGRDSRIFAGGFGGVRYLLTDNVAGVARAGFGSAYLTVGVDVKLK